MARWLGFIDNAGKERPLEGPTSVEDVVSHLAPVVKELESKSRLMATYADLNLDLRSRRRTGASQVEIHKGILDRYVVLRDHTPGKSGEWRTEAAAGIEAEHHVLRDAMRQVGGH